MTTDGLADTAVQTASDDDYSRQTLAGRGQNGARRSTAAPAECARLRPVAVRRDVLPRTVSRYGPGTLAWPASVAHVRSPLPSSAVRPTQHQRVRRSGAEQAWTGAMKMCAPPRVSAAMQMSAQARTVPAALSTRSLPHSLMPTREQRREQLRRAHQLRALPHPRRGGDQRGERARAAQRRAAHGAARLDDGAAYGHGDARADDAPPLALA